jgi:HAD superfamily hydrolase (TIGR01509 family)
MIKTVVVDLGGVLFAEGKSVATKRLAELYGYDPRLVGDLLSSPESVALRKGLLSDAEFWKWAKRQLPPNYDIPRIREEWYNGYILDGEILALITELKGKYKIIAFSGNIKSRVEFLEEKYHFRHLFDGEVYSFDHHLTKPDKRFVEVMIEKAEAKPEEIVYLEDNETYARPAQELGVQVVLYKRGEIEKLRTELRQRGLAC